MTIALAQPQLDAIAAACRLQQDVWTLHAFGSVLRPDFRPGESDIDLLVEFEDLQPSELVEAYFGLEQQLNEGVGSSIELVMATAVRNPIVRVDIDASKQLIYAA
jgi:predicted nucleotidyltransferase